MFATVQYLNVLEDSEARPARLIRCQLEQVGGDLDGAVCGGESATTPENATREGNARVEWVRGACVSGCSFPSGDRVDWVDGSG